MKIKSPEDYRRKIEEILVKKEGVELEPFTEMVNEMVNGIRDGPKHIEREILKIQGSFLARTNDYLFSEPENLVQSGYPQTDIKVAIKIADQRKKEVIEWVKKNYPKLLKLRKEFENGERKESEK